MGWLLELNEVNVLECVFFLSKAYMTAIIVLLVVFMKAKENVIE